MSPLFAGHHTRARVCHCPRHQRWRTGGQKRGEGWSRDTAGGWRDVKHLLAAGNEWRDVRQLRILVSRPADKATVLCTYFLFRFPSSFPGSSDNCYHGSFAPSVDKLFKRLVHIVTLGLLWRKLALGDFLKPSCSQCNGQCWALDTREQWLEVRGGARTRPLHFLVYYNHNIDAHEVTVAGDVLNDARPD